jgi:FKBP-type peptidyl-prolyl cis-trans isomerase (trigger factor)
MSGKNKYMLDDEDKLDFQMLNYEIDQLMVIEKKITEVSAEMLRGVNLAISRLDDLREKLESEFERQNMKAIDGARKQKALYMLDDADENEEYQHGFFIGS